MLDPDQMAKWRLSLTQNPVMLTTDLSVLPISNLVERVDAAKEDACYKALEDFLGGKFQVKKKEEERREKQKAEAEAKTREEACQAPFYCV